MMNFDETKDNKYEELLKYQEQCLAEIEELNRQKNKELKEYLDELYAMEPLPPPFIHGYSEVQRLWGPHFYAIKSISGKMSGITRKYKSALMMHILTILTEQNKDYFKYYTSMNYLEYASFLFKAAPSKKLILCLLDNSMTWQEKNEYKPIYTYKNKFNIYLSLKEGVNIYNNNLKITELFDFRYSNFKFQTSGIKTKYDMEYAQYKEKIENKLKEPMFEQPPSNP